MHGSSPSTTATGATWRRWTPAPTMTRVEQLDVETGVAGTVVAALELEGRVGNVGADGQRAVGDEAVVDGVGSGCRLVGVTVRAGVARAAGECEDGGCSD